MYTAIIDGGSSHLCRVDGTNWQSHAFQMLSHGECMFVQCKCTLNPMRMSARLLFQRVSWIHIGSSEL